MIVGAYSLHLYCDAGNKEPGMPGDGGAASPHVRNYEDPGFAEFVGDSEAECRRQAKAKGWKLNRDGRAICARCRANKLQ